MDRVLDRLWIGSFQDLDESVPLRDLGFSAVVDLREKPTARTDVDVHSLRHRDGDRWSVEQVDDALHFISDRIQLGRVLVACTAGMSRSVSIAVGYLVRCGYDEPSAYAAVRAARSVAHPMPGMLEAALRGATTPEARGMPEPKPLAPELPPLPHRDLLTRYLNATESTIACDHIADKISWNPSYPIGAMIDVECLRVELSPGVTARHAGCKHSIPSDKIYRFEIAQQQGAS